MSFVWTLPGRLPDQAALDRMKQHFPEPAEPMPSAWFMGEINFWTSLMGADPAEFEVSELGHTIRETVSGIRCFPEVQFVPVWEQWMLYLLPYALANQEYAGWFITLSEEVIGALLNRYPNGIVEEYPGFRDDIMHAICARAIPHKLGRDNPQPNGENFLIVNDIWDYSLYFSLEPNESLSLSILFCLKYLGIDEIEDWAASIFTIDSVQFHLDLIIWWRAFNKFLQRAQDWPQDGKINALLKETGLTSLFFLPTYTSFEEFIPAENLAAFKNCFTQQLTHDIFQRWAADIRANSEYYLSIVDPVLQVFESEFFWSIG